MIHFSKLKKQFCSKEIYRAVIQTLKSGYFCSILHPATCRVGRRGGLMLSVLDSGLKGLGSSPGRVIVLCSCNWARDFTLTVPLSTQEYKWVPANCLENLTKCWEVTCTRIPSRRSSNTPSCFMLWKLGYAPAVMSHLARKT